MKVRTAGLKWQRQTLKISRFPAREKQYILEVTGNQSPIPQRKEWKNVIIRTGYEIIERTIDKYGQFLLPSDIEANELVLELTMIAYNILRMIGQETIGGRGPKPRHKVHRRRLRTVIGNLIMLASHITTHARQAAIAEQAK